MHAGQKEKLLEQMPLRKTILVCYDNNYIFKLVLVTSWLICMT